jgi:hypothetical protein
MDRCAELIVLMTNRSADSFGENAVSMPEDGISLTTDPCGIDRLNWISGGLEKVVPIAGDISDNKITSKPILLSHFINLLFSSSLDYQT